MKRLWVLSASRDTAHSLLVTYKDQSIPQQALHRAESIWAGCLFRAYA